MPLISWEKMTRFSWVLSFHSWALTRWNRKLLLFYLLHQEMDARAKLINVHEQCMYLNPVVFDPLAGKEPINHGKNLPLWYEFKGKFKRKKARFLQNKATLEFTTLSNIIVIADRSEMHQCPKKVSIKINKIFLPLNSKDMRINQFVGYSHQPDMYKIHKK